MGGTYSARIFRPVMLDYKQRDKDPCEIPYVLTFQVVRAASFVFLFNQDCLIFLLLCFILLCMPHLVQKAKRIRLQLIG